MKKGTDVAAQARREAAGERTRILGIKREAPSSLEKASLVWKDEKAAQEMKKQKVRPQRETEPSLNFQKFSIQKTAKQDKQELFGETSWKMVKPGSKEGKKKSEISLNVSTVRAIAKKLIAREWARILGKPQNLEFDSLEREAASWMEKKEEEDRRKKELELKIKKQKEILRDNLKRKKEEERRRKEELKMKIGRQKKIFKKGLYQFGQKLRQGKEALKPEMTASLLEEALESVGEVADIKWHKQGCDIWLEPWEEKKKRRISGDTLPVIFKARVNQKLDLSFYEQVDKERVLDKMREAMLNKSLQGLLIKDEEEAERVLEEASSRLGQVIDIKRTEHGWDVSFEPWERVRKRNIENKGKGPINGDQIGVNWVEGEFSLAPK